jgi:hypothetical protein
VNAHAGAARLHAAGFPAAFTGTFSEDQNTISGAWEKGANGGGWEHDFTLTYRRAG